MLEVQRDTLKVEATGLMTLADKYSDEMCLILEKNSSTKQHPGIDLSYGGFSM